MKKLLLILVLCGIAAAQTAPTRTSYTETASWGTTGASKVTPASVTCNNGDLVVYAATSENNDVLPVPTWPGGPAFTSQQTNTAASSCGIQIATASCTGTVTAVITGTNFSSSVHQWGFGVWVYSNTGGVGNSTTPLVSTARTVSLTPTAAHSAVVWIAPDFSAAAVGATTLTPTPTTTDEATAFSGYAAFVGDLTDQTSAGATSYGLTGAVSGKLTKAAIEIKGTGAGATKNCTLTLMGAGPC